MPPAPPRHPRIVLFDGECNFCSASVNFMIDHDPRGQLRFASQQSATGRQLMADRGMAGQAGSVVFLENDHAYTRSAASLRMARYLTWPWRLAQWLVVVPRPILDALYDLVATHRYRFFGRRDACRMPTEALRERYLER
jgi:predicted DCC family thiol-disulfide oxidoreductase YuxK